VNNTLQRLRQKKNIAAELRLVVKTMKSMAAAQIRQYENALSSLSDYYNSLALGIALCLKHTGIRDLEEKRKESGVIVIVFGSDQGMAGQFNNSIAEYTIQELGKITGKKEIWSVGDRIHYRLLEKKIIPTVPYSVPGSLNAIIPFIKEILNRSETYRESGKLDKLYTIHNRLFRKNFYTPVVSNLFPLDIKWQESFEKYRWPTKKIPQIFGHPESMLEILVREYIFISLYKTCVESMASENATRLLAMQHAEKNIDEVLENLTRDFNQLRQNAIDEELFDIISGFEALKGKNNF
jgi:F-type H+-transporting ATPase subunit gamma